MRFVFYPTCPHCGETQQTLTECKGDKASSRREISTDLFLMEGIRKCKDCGQKYRVIYEGKLWRFNRYSKTEKLKETTKMSFKPKGIIQIEDYVDKVYHVIVQTFDEKKNSERLNEYWIAYKSLPKKWQKRVGQPYVCIVTPASVDKFKPLATASALASFILAEKFSGEEKG